MPCIAAWLAALRSPLQFVLRHCNFLALMRSETAYTELLSGTDSAMMPWLRKFQVSPQGSWSAVSGSCLAADFSYAKQRLSLFRLDSHCNFPKAAGFHWWGRTHHKWLVQAIQQAPQQQVEGRLEKQELSHYYDSLIVKYFPDGQLQF